MRGPNDFFNHLKMVGFQPRTIIDVGVARGTDDIYEAFPDAYYVLVDPIREYEPNMLKILETLDGEYHVKALSDAPGEMEMFVSESALYISSLQFDHDHVQNNDNLRTVPLTTIDELFGQGGYRAPVMLKTDCQGHDLNVISGAKQSLASIEVIICELPVYGPWGGGYEFIDYVNGLDELGYRFYDVWGWLYRDGDRRLQHMDLVFVKTDGLLRQNKLYPQGEKNVGYFAQHYRNT